MMGIEGLLRLILSAVIILIIGGVLGIGPYYYFVRGSMESPWFRRTFALLSTILNVSAILVLMACIPSFILFVYWTEQMNVEAITGQILEWIFGSSLFLLGFYKVAYTQPIQQRPELAGLQYEKYGRLYFWGKATLALHDRKGWLPRFMNNCLESMRLLPLEEREPLRIVGPAALHGEYEANLGERAKKELGRNVEVYASDIAKTNHLPSYELDGLSYTYTECVDARELKHVLPVKADIILDIKGAVWHIASASKRQEQVESLLMDYYDMLHPQGLILMDGYKSNAIWITLNAIFLQMTGRLWGYGEGSTFSYTHKVYNSSSLAP